MDSIQTHSPIRNRRINSPSNALKASSLPSAPPTNRSYLFSTRNAQSLTTEEVIQIDHKACKNQALTPILFSSLEHDMIDVFSEIGYGETTESDTNDAEIIVGLIQDKVNKCELSSSRKHQLLTVLLNNLEAFGCETSKCRMSELSPMKVQLMDPPSTNLSNWAHIGTGADNISTQ